MNLSIFKKISKFLVAIELVLLPLNSMANPEIERQCYKILYSELKKLIDGDKSLELKKLIKKRADLTFLKATKAFLKIKKLDDKNNISDSIKNKFSISEQGSVDRLSGFFNYVMGRSSSKSYDDVSLLLNDLNKIVKDDGPIYQFDSSDIFVLTNLLKHTKKDKNNSLERKLLNQMKVVFPYRNFDDQDYGVNIAKINKLINGDYENARKKFVNDVNDKINQIIKDYPQCEKISEFSLDNDPCLINPLLNILDDSNATNIEKMAVLSSTLSEDAQRYTPVVSVAALYANDIKCKLSVNDKNEVILTDISMNLTHLPGNPQWYLNYDSTDNDNFKDSQGIYNGKNPNDISVTNTQQLSTNHSFSKNGQNYVLGPLSDEIKGRNISLYSNWGNSARVSTNQIKNKKRMQNIPISLCEGYDALSPKAPPEVKIAPPTVQPEVVEIVEEVEEVEELEVSMILNETDEKYNDDEEITELTIEAEVTIEPEEKKDKVKDIKVVWTCNFIADDSLDEDDVEEPDLKICESNDQEIKIKASKFGDIEVYAHAEYKIEGSDDIKKSDEDNVDINQLESVDTQDFNDEDEDSDISVRGSQGVPPTAPNFRPRPLTIMRNLF